MSVVSLTLGGQLEPLIDVRSLVRWNLGTWMVLVAACGGGDAAPARENGQRAVSPPLSSGVAGQNSVAGRASTGQTGGAGISTPPPPPPSIAGMSAPPPPPPPGGAGAPAPLAGRGTMVTPPTAAGRGAAGMAAAAGMGAPAAGSGGACTMNLACKLSPPPSTGDIRQDCVDRINQFRTQCACMPPLERWTAAEGCADMMAESDSMTMMAHGGFQSRVCTPGGNGQNECPGYRSEAQVIGTCLQQMWNEGPPPMTPCTGQCFQTYGHFLNMTNKSFKKVACGFSSNKSMLWAVQNFSP